MTSSGPHTSSAIEPTIEPSTDPVTDPVPPTPRLVAALVGCVVAALSVSALAGLGIVGPLMWLQAGGSSLDQSMALLLLGIAALFLVPPAVLMWVAFARLTTRPPHGAALMLGCLRAVGGFVLCVPLPVLAGRVGVAAGAVAVVGLAFLGLAQLLSAATRPPRPQA